ncbi:phosphotransferase family protein [Brevibacterium album]|uniref:phosphotransferase family protein n=1 Tax=Brevibacterium album TaxID=417948 RepID=UPI00041C054D|nr:phosphotransferase [Brevibacterium album]
MRTPPASVLLDGETWTIRRAWPGTEERTAVEAVSAGGHVRAGFSDASGIRLHPYGADPRLPALAASARAGSVVSHRPGRRAVVRSADGSRYTKVVREGRSRTILDGIGSAEAFAGPFRTPEVLGSDASTVTFAALPGRSLHRPEDFSAVEWERAWGEVLRAWCAAVGTGSATGTASAADSAGAGADAQRSTPVHGGGAEARVLRQWRDRAAGLLGAEARAYSAAVERTAEELSILPAPRLVPAHRDLHDRQLLWTPEAGPGLLDVDTACLADPGLDLGNLRAHARWRSRQGVWSSGQAAVVAEHVDAVAHRAGVAPASLELHERSALLRLGAVYAFRPAWVEAARELRCMLVGEGR